MADAHERSPLGDRAAALPAAITEQPYAAMVTVWAHPAAVTAVSAAVGVPLPTVPGTSARAGGRTAIWMGPQEWLLLDPAVAAPTLIGAAHAALPDGAELDGAQAAVDVSAQRIALRLTAPWARDVLAAGCALDLHPRVFPRGRAATTNLALTNVVLIAEADDGTDFTVLVRSTYCRYLADWLIDAAAEYLIPAV
jgi:sarcosine oxidase subunit gamma